MEQVSRTNMKFLGGCIPKNLGETQEEVICTLMLVAMVCRCENGRYRHTLDGKHYVTYSTIKKMLKVFRKNDDGSTACLLQGKFEKGEGSEKPKAVLKDIRGDMDVVERVLRETAIHALGLTESERNTFRPAYPEPQCYRLVHGEFGSPPQRFVTSDWIRWYLVNGYQEHPLKAALINILAAEFADADHSSKECDLVDPFTGEDVEIKIYHVTRERV